MLVAAVVAILRRKGTRAYPAERATMPTGKKNQARAMPATSRGVRPAAKATSSVPAASATQLVLPSRGLAVSRAFFRAKRPQREREQSGSAARQMESRGCDVRRSGRAASGPHMSASAQVQRAVDVRATRMSTHSRMSPKNVVMFRMRTPFPSLFLPHLAVPCFAKLQYEVEGWQNPLFFRMPRKRFWQQYLLCHDAAPWSCREHGNRGIPGAFQNEGMKPLDQRRGNWIPSIPRAAT